ncbi:MAG: branched-chain amino acid transport system II carrier protein [Oscillospiraceae bacterium]|nr:branched-chain amino acid transport system II carrier protein [Oscillospiraceae bacterium]
MKKDLSIKELAIMGGALFSMHFGAACMLFPVQWGKDAGTALWPVFAGVLLSGVLLPFFGYLALVKGDGTFLELTRRISPEFGTVFAALTIFVIGPLYMVPRMSAAAWAAIVQITGLETESMLPVILFSIVYYLITYWFVMNPGEVLDKIGKILFPILLVVVTAVIIKSLVTPISREWAAPSFDQNPVIYGFLEGYATADLQCALLFGIVVVQGIRNAGIGGKAINKNLVKVGIIGLGLLMVTILGHMIAGANTGGTIDLTLSALYTEMVLVLWGKAGGILFNVALVAAALTTAIGAVSSTSEIWEEIMHEKNSKICTYRNFCIASCVLSCIVSFADLDTIVKVVGPVLDACYPAAIVIAMYYCLCRNNSSGVNLRAAKWALIVTFVISIIELISRYSVMFSLGWSWAEGLYSRMPLSAYSLAWLPVSIVVYASVRLLANKSN